MQFNSIEFIFYFLPAFLILYHLVAAGMRPAVLAVGSVLFYCIAASWSALPVGLLLGLVVLGYAGGIALDRRRSLWLLLPLCAVFAGALAFFKVYDGGTLLPLGMSFYTFQLIAYLADIYRGRIAAERGPVRFLAEMTMFPKLLSGPIAPSEELQRGVLRPHRRPFTFHLGLQEFILGLALKVVLANHLGGVWAQGTVFGFESVSTPYMWLALVTFCLRLYFDFYGYSLMAVGLGHMLGFNLPQNFLEPYSAKSVSEFFRRWHASLGRWFRDHVYIPLGGNRRGTARTVMNLAVVWVLTGLWHGPSGGYLLWAGILLVFIILEKFWLKKALDRSRVWCHFYLVLVIVLSWVPFAAGGVGESVTVFRRLFALGGVGETADFAMLAPAYMPFLGLGLFFATPIPGALWRKIQKYRLADAALFLLFWVCLYFIATAEQDPFIYFGF